MSAVESLNRMAPGVSLSMAQRLALRMLHAGALLRGATGTWSGRSFPHQTVRDETVRCLAAKGLARLETYAGLYDQRREICVITPAGEAERRGQPAIATRAPPVAAELVLREVEGALQILAAEAEQLRAEILQDSAAILAGRQEIAAAEARISACEKRLTQRMDAAESLRRRRVELAALVEHACERLGTAMREGGR